MDTEYSTRYRIETPFGSENIVSASERFFLKSWYARYGKTRLSYLRPQYPIGKYRVDFAHALTRTVIEIDGAEHYLEPDVIVRDRKRQDYIESLGWRVIRFGSWKVFKHVEVCISEAYEVISNRQEIESWMKCSCQQYQPGDIAKHRMFGVGTIIKSEMDGSTEFVEIQFEGKIGKKRLNTEFAKMIKQTLSNT